MRNWTKCAEALTLIATTIRRVLEDANLPEKKKQTKNKLVYEKY
jgi:hypothetical protein